MVFRQFKDSIRPERVEKRNRISTKPQVMEKIQPLGSTNTYSSLSPCTPPDRIYANLASVGYKDFRSYYQRLSQVRKK